MKNIHVRQMFIILLSFIVIVFTSESFCQDAAAADERGNKTLLGFSAGINDFNQRDNYLSPYTYYGISYGLNLIFRVSTGSGRHSVEGYYSTGSLSSDIQVRDVNQTSGYIRYSYLHLIDTWDVFNRPLGLRLGGGVSSVVSNIDFNTKDETGYITYDQGWYWSHSLNFSAAGEYLLSPGRSLSVQFTVPVFGIVSRPVNGHRLNSRNIDVFDNFIEAAGKGTAEYVWDNFVMYTDIEYTHQLSENVQLLAGYRFWYISSDKPDPLLKMNTYMNNFMIGFLWNM